MELETFLITAGLLCTARFYYVVLTEKYKEYKWKG